MGQLEQHLEDIFPRECDCNRAFDIMFYENYEILDSRSLEWADRQMLYLLRKRKSLFNKMNTY